MINLSLGLASTIRHDGHGGVADDLVEPAGLTAWVRDRAPHLGDWAAGFAADEEALASVVALRTGVRALFAYAVRPGPPSPADAHRLLPLPAALDRVNSAAARVLVTPRLTWVDGDDPVGRPVPAGADPRTALLAALARATIDFLSGPDRPNLRACTAPRCVRYFVKGHGRQEFCKPSCSNRARAARHYQRQQAAVATVPAGVATEPGGRASRPVDRDR
ncbi:CGNR zinc finger domain-containing protein [Plantactinospora sp. GCM10030261]|uniref:CGNR zinc finger domain-containing protein n=1 Tax=Plantactinospora sp. GCM10030261 TaxID=3273420 RepID=UPI00361ECA97